MGALFNIINVPLAYVLRFLANLFNNDFAAAIAVFTLIINVVLIPISIKSQKSAVQQMRIKPKMDDLRKRFGDDRQKMAAEQQKLYQDEGVSMSGGCLPMIIRLVIMFSIYSLILSPLTYMSGTGKSFVDESKNKTDYIYTTITTELSDKSIKDYDDEKKAEYEQAKKDLSDIGWQGKQKELEIINITRKDPEAFKNVLPAELYAKIEKDLDYIIKKDNESQINYNLFGVEGLDLTETPKFSIDIFKKAELNWIIPVSAFLAQILTSLVTMKINKKNNPDAPSMAGMMLTMPLISLFIGFGLPGGVGFYWVCSSLIGGLIQAGVQLYYGPHKMLARERAKELSKQCDFETKQLDKLAKDTQE